MFGCVGERFSTNNAVMTDTKCQSYNLESCVVFIMEKSLLWIVLNMEDRKIMKGSQTSER
jgi:hypothetical protein